MGEDHDIGKPRCLEVPYRNRRARQLHERKDALLHARPARGSKQHEGRFLLDGRTHRGDDRFARRHAERAAHEREILHRDDDRESIERALAGNDRILGIGLLLGFLEPVGIAPLVAEFERIEGCCRKLDRRIGALIEHRSEPDIWRHAHVIAGARDDELIGFEIAIEHHLSGFGAFDPHVLRRLALDAENVADLGANEILDPVHGATPLKPWAISATSA